MNAAQALIRLNHGNVIGIRSGDNRCFMRADGRIICDVEGSDEPAEVFTDTDFLERFAADDFTVINDT